MMFNERKVAQMAAYLLHKRGGRMSHLKLMKLLYLADRESMRRFGAPISGDHVVAMPHGPVLSRVYDHMTGMVESCPDGWEDWITDRENHEVSLRKKIDSRDDLDMLSDADIEVLDEVWANFGRMSRWKLRDYTHDQCPEWQDPEGSSEPIPYSRVFEALGFKHDDALERGNELDAHKALDAILARL